MRFLATEFPADVIREPGFADWVVYALLAALGVRELRAWFRPDERKISGSIETREGKEPAIKADVELQLQAVVASVNSLKAHVDSKVKEITDAGDKRAEKIITRIETETKAIREETERKIAEVRARIHEMAREAAAHGAQIADLQSRDHSHDMQLLTLRSAGSKPR